MQLELVLLCVVVVVMLLLLLLLLLLCGQAQQCPLVPVRATPACCCLH